MAVIRPICRTSTSFELRWLLPGTMVSFLLWFERKRWTTGLIQDIEKKVNSLGCSDSLGYSGTYHLQQSRKPNYLGGVASTGVYYCDGSSPTAVPLPLSHPPLPSPLPLYLALLILSRGAHGSWPASSSCHCAMWPQTSQLLLEPPGAPCPLLPPLSTTNARFHMIFGRFMWISRWLGGLQTQRHPSMFTTGDAAGIMWHRRYSAVGPWIKHTGLK